MSEFAWRLWGSKNCETCGDIYLRLERRCFKIRFEEKWGRLSGMKRETVEELNRALHPNIRDLLG